MGFAYPHCRGKLGEAADQVMVVWGNLIVPPTTTVRYGPSSFAVAGPSTWNALPAPLRNDELSAVSFRRQLKTELYIRAI